MKKLKYVLPLLFLLAITVPASAWDGGTDTTKVKAKVKGRGKSKAKVTAAPKADTATAQAGGGYIVLVALHAERNRIAEAKRRGDMELLGHIQEDAEEIRKRTIADFTENFQMYPVYFVVDTDIIKIAKGQSDVVFTDKNGKRTSTPDQIKSGKFVIAYYTLPDMQYWGEAVVADSERWVNQPRFFGYALVLYNSKFQQFNFYKKPFLATYNDKTVPYAYKSKVCNMEYYPLAEEMGKKARRRRGVARFFGL